MVPPFSPESPTGKKPPKSTNCFKYPLHVIRTHISSHPRFWLFIAFLWIQALIISFARTPPPCFPDRTPTNTISIPFRVVPSNDAGAESVAASNATKNEPTPLYSDECPSGRVYAYDLPPEFNKDLVLRDCADLDPWNWECGIIANHGYGHAAAELRRILPDGMHKSWYHTNQFTLEVIFHHRILKHKCRTLEPESATAFYIPFYAGLAVGKHLWKNDTAKRDHQCKAMLKWVKHQDHWSKFNGSDHFTTISRITWDFRRLTDPGRSWGSSFLNMPLMQKVGRFIVEKYPGDEMDITVPYPTGFHPKTRDALDEWQNFVRGYKRSTLFTFIKETNQPWAQTDFRQFLLNYCTKESGSCWAVDCAVSDCPRNSTVTLKPVLESEFCLQPKRDSYTSKLVFDCMIAGSVPVFFSNPKTTPYDQYEWFLPGEPESYSVFIDEQGVRNGTVSVKDVLNNFNKGEIERKREKLIETIPRITYAKPSAGVRSFKDAFDIALEGVLERIKEEKEWADFL